MDTSSHHHKSSKSSDEDEKAKAKQAADLIRLKLDSLYSHEPNAKVEASDIAEQGRPATKHQQYMFELSHSGKSIAEIQTAWHEYYQSLPDDEKREVWDEFYGMNQPQNTPIEQPKVHQSDSGVTTVHVPVPEPAASTTKLARRNSYRRSTVADMKQTIAHRTHSKQKLTAKHHFQSLLFGLAAGSFVVLILLFGFFNERFIAPFVTPSRQVSSTPIINDPTTTAVSNKSEIIIPKINVEIPVIYDVPTIQEAAVEKGLERGVVHYATTPNPGEKGNIVIFGHSSNNIFNPGKYKFAFVLLSKLENGDLFYLDKGGKRYVYKVYKKRIVQPNEVSVLYTADKPDTATLITCDPPGTSLHRLVVTGEQISPSITTNVASTAIKSAGQPSELPSNAPSLWQRIIDWL